MERKINKRNLLTEKKKVKNKRKFAKIQLGTFLSYYTKLIMSERRKWSLQ